MAISREEQERLRQMGSDRLLGLYNLCVQAIDREVYGDGAACQEDMEERNAYMQEILRRMKAGNNGN